MFLELIAVIFAGMAGAGLMAIISKVSGGRLPKWMTPLAAGGAMIAATISSEYSWFSRTTETLPEGFSIVETVETTAFYRPWTYVVPLTERFVTLDTASVQTNPTQPDLRLAQVYFYGRWSPLNRLNVGADCGKGQRAALTDGISFNDGGTIEGAKWVNVPDQDPLLDAICEVR
ncbi:hypothetical protein [Shimia sagamensis]|uniref:Uncharacterized protein n=1 Tax=Shimia sagamensis TaxID=1566352 RepID=A0ABY1PEZ7_9RHOB|nr:hypothetical protein [Shimia sagamensis]SMP32995.1 hypothetical protein SAMN06265373_1096 [Shimia sagamensis]